MNVDFPEPFPPVIKTSSPKMKWMLDGIHFMGEAGDSGKTTGDKEMMSFSNGMFHSSQCQAKGFAGAPYTASKEGDAINFSSDLTNKEGAKLHWSGKVTGNAIDATMTMLVEGQNPVTMWAKGTESVKKPGMTHEHKSAETKTGK